MHLRPNTASHTGVHYANTVNLHLRPDTATHTGLHYANTVNLHLRLTPPLALGASNTTKPLIATWTKTAIEGLAGTMPSTSRLRRVDSRARGFKFIASNSKGDKST